MKFFLSFIKKNKLFTILGNRLQKDVESTLKCFLWDQVKIHNNYHDVTLTVFKYLHHLLNSEACLSTYTNFIKVTFCYLCPP